MSATSNFLFLGIGGYAVALDRRTGEERWRQKLKSQSYVTIAFDGHSLFAACAGELFCLDPATGEPRWHNKLPGLGTGLIAFGGAAEPVLEAAREEAARAAAMAAAG